MDQFDEAGEKGAQVLKSGIFLNYPAIFVTVALARLPQAKVRP